MKANNDKTTPTVKRSRIRIVKPVNLGRDLWASEEVSTVDQMLTQHHGNGSHAGREIAVDVLANFPDIAAFKEWFATIAEQTQVSLRFAAQCSNRKT